MNNFIRIYSHFVLIYFIIGSHASIYYNVNVDEEYLNRKILVRNEDQIYTCPQRNGWITINHGKANILQITNSGKSVLINSDTKVGIYQMKCAHLFIDLIIIDISQFDILMEPLLPRMINKGNSYIFKIRFQPNIINDDKTYSWEAYQISGADNITFIMEKMFLIMQLHKRMRYGQYKIGLRTEYGKAKNFTFNIIDSEKHRRSPVYDFEKPTEFFGVLIGVKLFLIAFIGFGFIIIIIGTLLYLFSLSRKRNDITDIQGYGDLDEEEKKLVADKNFSYYKLMPNPMSRQKDVDLIIAMSKEIESRLGLHVEESFTYKLSQEELHDLKRKFPFGVCLNCVQFASQMMLTNQGECPFITHTCDVPPGKSFNRQILCECLPARLEEYIKNIEYDYISPECRQNCINNNNISDITCDTYVEQSLNHNSKRKKTKKKKKMLVKTKQSFESNVNKKISKNRDSPQPSNIFRRNPEIRISLESIISATGFHGQLNTSGTERKSEKDMQNSIYNHSTIPNCRECTSKVIHDVIRKLPKVLNVAKTVKMKDQSQNVDWCFVNDQILQCRCCIKEAVAKFITRKVIKDHKYGVMDTSQYFKCSKPQHEDSNSINIRRLKRSLHENINTCYDLEQTVNIEKQNHLPVYSTNLKLTYGVDNCYCEYLHTLAYGVPPCDTYYRHHCKND